MVFYVDKETGNIDRMDIVKFDYPYISLAITITKQGIESEGGLTIDIKHEKILSSTITDRISIATTELILALFTGKVPEWIDKYNLYWLK